MHTRRKLGLGCAGLFILLFAGAIALPTLLESYAKWLIVEDPREPADAVVALAGAEGERLAAAIRLCRDDPGARLVIVGPDTPLLEVYTGEDSLSQGEAKRRIAIRKGIPNERVVLALGATSTYEEAQTIHELATHRNWKHVIVVTSPFHSRRSRATFRSVLDGTGVEVSLYSLPLADSQSNPESWWRRERDTMAVVTETMKLGYYVYRYGIWPWS